MRHLYHAEVFMPAAVRVIAPDIRFGALLWTRHARLELVNDRYGVIPSDQVPRTFSGKEWELIEAEVDGASVTKWVFRRAVDGLRSLVIVLRPIEETGNTSAAVVTCWTNLNSDKHHTLDKSKYETH